MKIKNNIFYFKILFFDYETYLKIYKNIDKKKI
jgi:hypothetical protein